MTLPILIISEFSFSTKLQLKKSLSWEYESVWCRLLKVAFWNGLNGNELIHVFGPEISTRQGLLNKPQKTLVRKLAYYFNVPRHNLIRAYPPRHKVYTSSTMAEEIRGCKECFEQGFHSALFQLTFLEKCPLHGTPLIAGCPTCQLPEQYTVNRNFGRHGYRCSNCNQSIIEFNVIPSSAFISLLPRLSNWFQFLITAIQYTANSATMLDQRWLEAIREWNVNYVEIPILRQSKNVMLNALCNPIDNENYSQKRRIYDDARTYYFRVRRVLRKIIFKQKRYEIQYSMYSESPVISDNRTQIYAYDFWRIAWERSLKSELMPIYMKASQMPITLLMWVCVRMSNSKDTDSEIIHKCRFEITASYSRCLALSQWMEKNGGYMVSPLIFRFIIPRLCILNRR